MGRYNRNRQRAYAKELWSPTNEGAVEETEIEEKLDNSFDGYFGDDSADVELYSEPIEHFCAKDFVEEPANPEPEIVFSPEEKTIKAAIAMKVIAGSYGATEEEIRSKLAEDGYSFEEITDVKKRILNGTYYN